MNQKVKGKGVDEILQSIKEESVQIVEKKYGKESGKVCQVERFRMWNFKFQHPKLVRSLQKNE